ncbi:MAG: RNA polymerase sigma factor [Ruminococcus sp.]|nr:RNA polymerase sigma factor [Ruminococcus sp.]MDE6785106.1 RNA polymerase sigma factor [Ruminococcus sp.]
MSVNKRLENAIDKYGDIIFRICLLTLKNHADAEDAVQETFIIYFRKSIDFENSEHEKAWLISVAMNKCRDILRFNKRHRTEPEDVLLFLADKSDKNTDILEALVEVPEKFRIVLTLHYIEGYKINEIAQIIGKSPSAVKMRLSKGRELLREIYTRSY